MDNNKIIIDIAVLDNELKNLKEQRNTDKKEMNDKLTTLDNKIDKNFTDLSNKMESNQKQLMDKLNIQSDQILGFEKTKFHFKGMYLAATMILGGLLGIVTFLIKNNIIKF